MKTNINNKIKSSSKITILILIIIIIGIILNLTNYQFFLKYLSIIWYITTIIIIYAGINNTKKYHFLQFNLKEFIKSLGSKSKNDISPLSSLSLTLAAKIGIGSLSGVALTLYLGGVGSIFWLIIISLLVSINTYVECQLGIKYRKRIGNNLIGGPSLYIKNALKNPSLSILYSILIIITYSTLFLSIQSNTIVTVLTTFNFKKIYIVLILAIITYLIIKKGLKGISKTNSILVPIMLISYLSIGIYILLTSDNLISIILTTIKEAFNIKSIIPVFLIGMQRAIFITESGIGTSAISASSCDNNPHNQGLLEVLGIHLTTFIICLTTFLIIVTSDYQTLSLNNPNGIEIVMYAFTYHFGNIGKLILTIITILFAVSTIISGYFFGESNLKNYTQNNKIINIFKIIIIIIIIISGYISPTILWNLTDFFIAILSFINITSILKINNK